MNDAVRISSGQLCQRETSAGFAVVGVIFLPDSVKPAEGCQHALSLVNDQARLSLSRLNDIRPSHYAESSVGALLGQPIWNDSLVPGVMPIRLYPVFPERNGYAVYGASRTAGFGFGSDHEWARLLDGRVIKVVSGDGREVGLSVDQLLRDLAVWDGGDGNHYTIPCTPPVSWSVFDRLAQMRADVADGLMAAEAFRESVRTDPLMCSVGIAGEDLTFFRYIAELRRAGALLPVGPVESTAYVRREKVAEAVLQEVLRAAA